MGRKCLNKEHRMISLSKEINSKLREEVDASLLIEDLLISHYELRAEQDMTSDEKIKKWTKELVAKQLEVKMKQELDQRFKEIDNGKY